MMFNQLIIAWAPASAANVALSFLYDLLCELSFYYCTN